MMKQKEEIQSEIVDTILENNFRGIIRASVRSGKTRMLLSAIKRHNDKENPRILVLYPNIDIKNSWIDECEKIGCPFKIHYCTFASIKKVMDEQWDYIIFDEAHLIPSEHKLPIAGYIAKTNPRVIFASGTYSKSTLADLVIYTSLPLIVDYNTEEAIEDEIICDYTVFIHTYSLSKRQEERLDVLTERVTSKTGFAKQLAAIARMRFINSNDSLKSYINNWIVANSRERFLMFVENEKFGKKFGVWMYNSKSKDDEVLQKFLKGDINRLCLIKKGSAGVTYPNLNNILITAVNSNGENLEQMLGRSLLKDTPKAAVHIFTTVHPFQLNWIRKALENIPEDKIIWL